MGRYRLEQPGSIYGHAAYDRFCKELLQALKDIMEDRRAGFSPRRLQPHCCAVRNSGLKLCTG
jgi:hypothetical protein